MLKCLNALVEFGFALANVHFEIDHRRFVPDGGVYACFEFFKEERPESNRLIAVDEMTPVGYALVRMEPASIETRSEPRAWLHDVYVDPQSRGSGVGRQLVLAAIESAQKMGSSSLSLVFARQQRSQGLYDHLGLRPTMNRDASRLGLSFYSPHDVALLLPHNSPGAEIYLDPSNL